MSNWSNCNAAEFRQVPMMKVLVSAYACAPEMGSEPEVGFRTVLAAARRHEVWVLTQTAMADAVRGALVDHPLAERIHLEAVQPSFPPHRPGLRGFAAFHWRHDQWQRQAAAQGIELDRRIGFDVVHHVTLAAYWMRTGVAAINKPLVWGPVGGGVEPPWRLLGELGGRGLLEEATRTSVRWTVGLLTSTRVTDKASVIFVQNPATARRIRSRAKTSILPNAIAVDVGAIPPAGPRTRDIAFTGRLVPWKGARLAVRTMRYVSTPGASLRIYGDGDERESILKASQRWGVAEHVSFEGQLPRRQLLTRIARAGVVLHPALHDESPIAVAEALTLSTPLVCLDHGGPAELVRQWHQSPSITITPAGPEATARALAAAIDRFLVHSPPVSSSPRAPRDRFEDRILDAYEQAATMDRPAW
jgi:glycosyltransferase involved in cell wall biosynthesis